jgi:hypothetical protein
MGDKQVVLLYVSIYHTYISQWTAKMCQKSRAQTALLRPKAQFTAVFEDHLRGSPMWILTPRFSGKYMDLSVSAPQY